MATSRLWDEPSLLDASREEDKRVSLLALAADPPAPPAGGGVSRVVFGIGGLLLADSATDEFDRPKSPTPEPAFRLFFLESDGGGGLLRLMDAPSSRWGLRLDDRMCSSSVWWFASGIGVECKESLNPPLLVSLKRIGMSNDGWSPGTFFSRATPK